MSFELFGNTHPRNKKNVFDIKFSASIYKLTQCGTSILKDPTDMSDITLCKSEKPRSSLKRSASQMTPDTCPMVVDKRLSKIDDPYDPSDIGVYADLTKRTLAIENYLFRETGVDYPDKKPRCTFGESDVIHFELLGGLQHETQCVEKVKFTDPHDPVAARALCRIIAMAEKKRFPANQLIPAYQLILEDAVRDYLKLNEKPTTVEKIKASALEQARDLAYRCELRLAYLPKKPQFNFREAVKLVKAEKVAEDGPWDQVNEAAYAEKLLTRIPDALTQPFMQYRADSRVVGLDATDRTLCILRNDVIPSLL